MLARVPLVCLLFAAITIMTTSSRMVYAFARDGGLPASRFLARVHKRLNVPLNALYFTTILVIIFGLIFLGSSRYFSSHRRIDRIEKKGGADLCIARLMRSSLRPWLLSISPTECPSSSMLCVAGGC
jgi:hypothetical protein